MNFNPTQQPLSVKFIAVIAFGISALIAVNVLPVAWQSGISVGRATYVRNALVELYLSNCAANLAASNYVAAPEGGTAALYGASSDLLQHLEVVISLPATIERAPEVKTQLRQVADRVRSGIIAHDGKALSETLLADQVVIAESARLASDEKLGEMFAQEQGRNQRDNLNDIVARTLSILLICTLMIVFILGQKRRAVNASSALLATTVHELDEVQRIARLGTVRWDFVSDNVSWSDRFAFMFGLEQGGQMTGAKFEALLHPDDVAKVQKTEQLALALSASSGRPEVRAVNYRALKADGTYIELNSQSELMADGSGKPLFMISTVLDITEQANRERKLAANEHDLEVAQRIARLGSFRSDLKSGKSVWSRQMYELLGLQPEQGCVSRATLIHADDLGDYQRQIDELLLSGLSESERLFVINVRLRHTDGSARPFRGNAVMRYDKTGAAFELSGTIQDISAELAQEVKLKAAVAEAERANRAKSDFLAVMSHELRTPLNGVLGMLDAIHETQLDPDQRDQVQVARSSANDLLTILNDILDIAKIEAGKLEVESAPFEVRQLVSSVIKLHMHHALEKGIKLESRIAANVPAWVEADSARLRQIMVNFVSNAIKFTPSGTIALVIVVAKGEVADSDMELSCSITDSGIGIPFEKQAHVFEQFNQLDLSYNRRFGGTGLGLSICRSLTELMKGNISFVSAPGVGSTFTVVIPVKQADVPHHHLTENAAVTLRRMRVLVADDVSTNRIVACSILERLGQTADVVVDGLEAVEAVARTHYDIVLMDLSMPHLDGYEATRRIRALGPPYANLPIIALTAHAGSDIVHLCRDAGFTSILTKPLLRPNLVAALLATSGAKQNELLQSTASDALTMQAAAVSIKQRQALERRADDMKEQIGEDGVANVFEAGIMDLTRLSTILARFSSGETLADSDLKRTLHSIAGIAGTLGCKMLADDARQLERNSGALSVGDRALVGVMSAIKQLHQDLSTISTSIRFAKSPVHLECIQ